jgi:hypothetical protein
MAISGVRMALRMGWRDRLFVVQKSETKKYFLAEKPHVAEQRVSAHVAWCARRVAGGVSVWLVGL